MPQAGSGATSARNARPGPNLAATRGLRVIAGGRSVRPTVTIAVSALDELHIDHVTARAERLSFATSVREALRQSGRHLARERYAALGMVLLELLRLTEQEDQRARAMASAPCPCGSSGLNHGDADSDALAVPVERVA